MHSPTKKRRLKKKVNKKKYTNVTFIERNNYRQRIARAVVVDQYPPPSGFQR
jgi:hypothetical protein